MRMPTYIDIELILPDCRVMIKRNKIIKGDELFQQVCEMLNIQDSRWFGIKCLNAGNYMWIGPDCDIGNVPVTANTDYIRVIFLTKVYPPNFVDRNIDLRTLEFLYRDLYSCLLAGSIVKKYENIVTIIALGKLYFGKSDTKIGRKITMQHHFKKMGKFLAENQYSVTKFKEDITEEKEKYSDNSETQILEKALEAFTKCKGYGERHLGYLKSRVFPVVSFFVSPFGIKLNNLNGKRMHTDWNCIKMVTLRNAELRILMLNGEEYFFYANAFYELSNAYYLLKEHFMNCERLLGMEGKKVKSEVDLVFQKCHTSKIKAKRGTSIDKGSLPKSRNPSFSSQGHIKGFGQVAHNSIPEFTDY